ADLHLVDALDDLPEHGLELLDEQDRVRAVAGLEPRLVHEVEALRGRPAALGDGRRRAAREDRLRRVLGLGARDDVRREALPLELGADLLELLLGGRTRGLAGRLGALLDRLGRGLELGTRAAHL